MAILSLWGMHKFEYVKSYFCNAQGVVLCLGPWVEKVRGSQRTSPRAEAVKAALKRLTPVQREFIRLYYFEGRSFRQIAEETGKTLSTLQKLDSRAKGKLAKLLSEVVKAKA